MMQVFVERVAKPCIEKINQVNQQVKRQISVFSTLSFQTYQVGGDSRIGNEISWCLSEPGREEKAKKSSAKDSTVQNTRRRSKGEGATRPTSGNNGRQSCCYGVCKAGQRRRRTQARKEGKGKKATKPQVKGRQRGENEEAEEED